LLAASGTKANAIANNQVIIGLSHRLDQGSPVAAINAYRAGANDNFLSALEIIFQNGQSDILGNPSAQANPGSVASLTIERGGSSAITPFSHLLECQRLLLGCKF